MRWPRRQGLNRPRWGGDSYIPSQGDVLRAIGNEGLLYLIKLDVLLVISADIADPVDSSQQVGEVHGCPHMNIVQCRL